MAKIELSIVIPAPREKVWAYATNTDNWPKFVANLQDATVVSGTSGVGAVVESSYKLVGDRTMKLSQTIEVQDEESGRFEGKMTEGFPGTNKWTYESVEDGAATKVSVLMEYTVPGSVLGQIADKLVIEKYNTKSIETTLENLKAQVI